MKKLVVVILMLLVLAVSVSADIRVTKASQDPDPVRAGDLVKVRFKVENTLEDTPSEMHAEFVPAYPFSLYTSNKVQNLGRLEGGEAAFFEYWLRVDPNAVDGENEIKLKVFADDSNAYMEFVFSVDVESEKIAVKPYIVASDLLTPGKNGKFTIEIANAGANDVKALELQLLSSDDYRLLSTSNYVYLGDLDVDDTESEDFSIYVPQDKISVSIPLRLQYRVNDQDYTDDVTLTLNLLSLDEAKELGLVKSSNTAVWVVIIIGVVILLWLWRRSRRKKLKL